jgi:hypothetical protein
MLISVVEDYYDPGYLPTDRPPAIRGFFPNCNLALRRSAWEELGGYDEELSTAEDMELCRRAAAAGRQLFFEPGAACRHQARPSLGALARQWWSYGVGSAAVQRRHRDAALEVFWSGEITPHIHRFRRLAAIERSPVSALVFATPFRVAGGLAVAAAIAAAAAGWPVATTTGAAAALALGWAVSRHPATRRTPWWRLPELVAVLTVIDLGSLLGGLWGGLRQRMLYLLAIV